MPVPLPESDTILMREHLFRNSKNLDIVLTKDPVSFRSIEDVGLGTFNYKLVDMDSIYDENSKESIIKKAFQQTVDFVQTSIIDILLVIILIAIFSLLISCAYPLFKKSGKELDLENQVGHQEDDDDEKKPHTPAIEATTGWNSTVSTPKLTSPYKEKFRPRTPLGNTSSTPRSDSINEKELMDVLRID